MKIKVEREIKIPVIPSGFPLEGICDKFCEEGACIGLICSNCAFNNVDNYNAFSEEVNDN